MSKPNRVDLFKFIDKRFVYPKLSNVDLSFVRIGGIGLANCMFVAARAYILAQINHWELIDPTWFKISLGPYIRREKDKRHYRRLFAKSGITGLRKCLILVFGKKCQEYDSMPKKGVIMIVGLGNYFEDLLPYHGLVFSYFLSITQSSSMEKVNAVNFNNIVGVHVRLGDYVSSLRTPIDWYENMIGQIEAVLSGQLQFYIFSDGTDEEISRLLTIGNVSRFFCGNALADIWALSKCRLIIGSDSTFSGWGAFLGQVPIIYQKCHYGNVLKEKNNQLVIDNGVIPNTFLERI